ncbi:MAG: hypothetical protein ABSD45_09420 [Terriglobia bacterium]|jgi:hypothetical protein
MKATAGVGFAACDPATLLDFKANLKGRACGRDELSPTARPGFLLSKLG